MAAPSSNDKPAPPPGWSFRIRHQIDCLEDMGTPVAYLVFWPDPDPLPDHVVEGGSDDHD